MLSPERDRVKILDLKKKVHGVKVSGGLIILILIIISALTVVMIIVNNFAQ